MTKITVRKQNREAGQATILVVLALSIFLLGAAGLAVDGSHLYAQRQMAQAAADAAAQAGILSIFDGTNGVSTNPNKFSTGAAFTCATSDARTPCYYAQTMNNFNTAADTISVDFPTAATVGVPTAPLASPASLVRVRVQRIVSTTLLSLLGPTSSTISASGTAAITSLVSPIPIIVTHPTRSNSFSASGTGHTAKIKICGGPRRSIQVNSNHTTSLGANGNPIVDLSQAGPLDPGDCTAGTGADFGDFGGPGANSIPFVLQPGSTGHYVQPASPIVDPLAGVNPPTAPSAAPLPTTLSQGSGICPSTASHGCTVFSPGSYTTKIEAKNTYALFKPGIYYLNGVNFSSAANGDMAMATGFTDTGAGTTGTGWTGNMLVYMTGTGSPPTIGSIDIGANGSVNLVGSPNASAYQGILFFSDRSAAAQSHTLSGGGGMTLSGTIYLNTLLSIMQSNPSQFQTLNMQGNAGSNTRITGEIIAPVLALSGTPGIVMNLNPFASVPVRQVALVN